MNADAQDEYSRLQGIAKDSWYASGPMPTSIRYLAGIFGRHFRAGNCLELGPAEGVMTEFLATRFSDLCLVEGSAEFCSDLAARFPRAEVVNSLFEDFRPTSRFDNLVLGHVLEHVADPVEILRSARDWISPGGVALIAVPNSHSLHRQAAVLMGLLDSEDQLNATDIHNGHRRVYDLARLEADFVRAGWEIVVAGGYWLKPLSNDQIHRQWDQAILDAYMQIGELHPDVAAEIYVIAVPTATSS